MNARRLHIEIPAKPESVSEIRHRVQDHAQALGMSAMGVADLGTVVSEACGNAVRYAYEDTDTLGLLEVALEPVDGEIDLRVRDHGKGICPRPDSDLQGLGLGLPLIGALSRSFCLKSELGVGTELRIRVRVDGHG